MEKKGTKIAYFVALAVVVVALVIAKVTNDGSGFVATGWALFPPVVAIALALISKEVYSSLFLRGIMAAPPGLGQFFSHAVIAVSFILHDRTTRGVSAFCRLRALIFFPLYTILVFFTSQRVKYPPYRE